MAWAPSRNRGKVRGGNGPLIAVVVTGVVFVGGVTAVLVANAGGAPTSPVGGSGAAVSSAGATELAPTGEVSAMGLPVYETPGFASGSAQAGGVTVQGADWAMGQVPLDIAVRPFWTLTNTGPEPVTLGEPQAEVREGCCPGPFEMGATTLAPGASTWLTFELAMHEGMDGWHDMGVLVPIEDAAGTAWLELNVTGDFRD